MGDLAALLLLLTFLFSCSQSTLQSERKIPAPPPPHIRDILIKDDTAHLNAKKTYAPVDKDNAKIFLFIAASVGTVALMAAVYCIYNSFYTKHQYLHTQLHNDPAPETFPFGVVLDYHSTMLPPACFWAGFPPHTSFYKLAFRDVTADPMDPPGFLYSSAADSSSVCLQKSGYGSISNTPSIISLPPSLSPPPSAMPFPPPFLSSRPLRTISAQDLEKSFI